MKKIIISLIIALAVLLPVKANALPEDEIVVHFFHLETWGYCIELGEFFDEIKGDYPNVEFKLYEISDFYNGKLFADALNMFGFEQQSVPFVVIGNKAFQGNAPGYKERYINTLDHYTENFYNDTLGVFLGYAEEKEGKDTLVEGPEPVTIPIFGEIDLVNGSLIGATFMLGIADGFNPCAMWVLIFLISILITMKDRKRMWTLGMTFILTSAIIYFLFMSAWLNASIFLGSTKIVRTAIGLFAMAMGITSLKKWYETKDGEVACDVVDGSERKKITDKIRKFTAEQNLLVALVGVIVLAISVNSIELVCSLGLPVIYTQFLTMAQLSKPQYYMYILLYTFFFMLDDIIVFSIAMYTMKLTNATQKYTKLSKLVGGIIMVLIGIALVFFPNLMI